MHALMRYTVRPEALDEHLRLLHAVYAELDAERPGDLRWVTYQLEEDPRTFVELVEGPDLPHPLPLLESFRRYRAELDERCEGRTFTELRVVASFGR